VRIDVDIVQVGREAEVLELFGGGLVVVERGVVRLLEGVDGGGD